MVGHDVIALLRDGENDFIENTFCTEDYQEIDTADEGLGPLFDLPANFLNEIRIEWDGTKLDRINKKLSVAIYNTNNTVRTGYREGYMIEGDDANGTYKLRIVPKQTSTKVIGIWYTYRQTATDAESPIIPAVEHKKLVNYAIAEILESEDKFDKAMFYHDKYEADCIKTYRKYKMRRYKQKRIIDVVGGEAQSGGGYSQYLNVVTE